MAAIHVFVPVEDGPVMEVHSNSSGKHGRKLWSRNGRRLDPASQVQYRGVADLGVVEVIEADLTPRERHGNAVGRVPGKSDRQKTKDERPRTSPEPYVLMERVQDGGREQWQC